jgi:3'-5' exoribonuclease
VSKVYVKDIREKDRVESVFKLTKKSLATGKSGKAFLALVLGDKTGEIDARIWEDVEAAEAIAAVGDLVHVKGVAVLHFGQPQVKVEVLAKTERGEMPEEDFVVPAAPEGPAAAAASGEAGGGGSGRRFSELVSLIEKVHDGHVRALLLSFLEDAELAALLRRAPAAKAIHHAYAGGLIDHILSCVKLAHRLCDHYPQADRDLVVAGAFLHDIGKTKELSFEKKVDYSDEGRLVGHLVMTAQWIHERAKRIEGFPAALEHHLVHIVLSHHGSLEYGSPKLPATLEALLVHHLDEIDSRVNSWLAAMATDSNENWTEFNKLYERHLYKGPSPTSAGRRPVEPRHRKRHKVPAATPDAAAHTHAPAAGGSAPAAERAESKPHSHERRDPRPPREHRERPDRPDRPDRPPRADKRPAPVEAPLTFKPFAAIIAEPEAEPKPAPTEASPASSSSAAPAEAESKPSAAAPGSEA